MKKTGKNSKAVFSVVAACIAVVIFIISVGIANAWWVRTCVYCDTNENGRINYGDEALTDVLVNIDSNTSPVNISFLTDDNGCVTKRMPDYEDSYIETLDQLPGDAVFILPPEGEILFELTDEDWSVKHEWLIDSAVCHEEQPGECWLTAGGVKFSTTTGTLVDEFKPKGGPHHSWGGNVNPACAPNKGHWNHVAHKDNLHFQATDIEVLDCGNVPGIDPGSESPVTPVNYIEFTGPSTMKGIKGNKDDYGDVCYFARAEDRNEPGSHGAKDGIDIDRYFLHVFDCDTGETLLLVDMDGDQDTVDPVTITGGNMQMHWQPCDN